MQTTRRDFLSTAAALTATAVAPRTLFAQASLEQRLAHDPLRPQFHLLPARNWMNDPNGPIWIPDGKGGFNGRYHMFFQYNPQGPTWGDMSWNHAVSRDMVHWDLLPVALTPTPNSPDSFGVFSGSAIAVSHGNAKRVYAVYTGTQKSDDAHATIRDGANNVQESQCLAWSDDPLLIRWTKDPQPIIPRPPEGMAITGFRDPSIWRAGDWYYMTVGSGIAKVGGCVLLYRSPAKGDLKQWEYLHPLTSGEWNGKVTSNPCDDGEMWECPEFFPLGNAHLLIYSTLGKVFWQSGDLDATTMRFTPKKTGELDLGAFYAPKTQLDAHGRRILWGWIPEKRSEDAMRTAGWSGMMSLPRVMSLDPDGTLRLTIAEQVHELRAGSIAVKSAGNISSLTLPAATGEFLVSSIADQAFTVVLTNAADNSEIARIAYAPATNSFTSGSREAKLTPGSPVKIHGYVDGSVIEMILGERIGDTQRFYYPQSSAPDIVVRVEGAGVHVDGWKIGAISKDRMTTLTATDRRSK
jgi:beta-fructofuranosidase